MLQDSLSKIKYLFVLALFLLPMHAMAGFDFPIVDQTDTGSNRLVAFWDTRARGSFIQVTNTSTSAVTVHVQFWDIANPLGECFEIDFDDSYTGQDTHVYNVSDLVTNTGVDVADVTDGSYGFVVISVTSGAPQPLIGMFRVVDETLGMEYRANAAGEELLEGDNLSIDNIVNFSTANGNNLSDLIGITYVSIDSGNVFAGPAISTTFGNAFEDDQIDIFDEIEFDTSCPEATFACAVGALDRSIDNSLPNSRGQLNQVCATNILDSNTSGWLEMPFSFFCNNEGCPDQPFFVGFIGLTNGDGTGSMDSWWTAELDSL